MEYTNSNIHWIHRFPDNEDPGMRGCFYCVIGIVIVVFLSMLFGSCQTIKYVPVEIIRTEYVSKTDTFIQKDSIHVKDSVFIYSRNDTMFVNKWHIAYKDKIVKKIICDAIVKEDSIQVPYPVEKKLSKWEGIKMDFGGMAIGASIVSVLMIIIGVVMKVRKKL